MQTRKLSKLPASKIQLHLHIRHPSMHPTEISKAIGCHPSECFAVGEQCELATSAGLAPRLHGETYWVAALGLESELPDQFIGMACRQLARHAEFFTRIRSGGGSARLVATIAETTLKLTPEVSGRLSDLGITLEAEFVSQ